MEAEPSTAPPSATVDLPLAPTRAELLKIIWDLAWPVIMTLSLESLVGLADMLMVGQLGANAVAGVGVGVQILQTVTGSMFAVGTGTLAIVARHVGARELRPAEEVLRQSLLAVAVLATAATLPVFAWAPELVRLFGVAEPVVQQGGGYVRTVMLGVPADALIFTVALGLRGAGDTRTPLIVGAVVGTLNVFGNYLLIFGHLGLPALGVVGAAVATAISFSIGALLILLLLARGNLVLRLSARGLRLRFDVIRRVLSVGYPAALENLLMQVGFYVYIVFASTYGTSAVAAYFIGVRILALSFLPGFGFSAAAATLVGQNLGANDPHRAERSGWESNRLAIYMMTAAGIVIFIAARPIAELFVDDAQVVADAVSFIRVLAAAQPLMAIDFTLAGALRGAGDTRFPLVTVFVGFYGCRLGFAWLAAFWLKLDLFWLWFALIGDYVARALLKGWRFRSGRWRHIRV